MSVLFFVTFKRFNFLKHVLKCFPISTLSQCQVHTGEEDHARHGRTISRRGHWTGLLVEESIGMTEDRDKWRKYVHRVANPRIEDGYRTVQNIVMK